ncbi:MAG: hypothetical protein HUK16_01930 [Bacteroidales bacterium]|nr:hypothetical protein [Bacteroidales bacterium]
MTTVRVNAKKSEVSPLTKKLMNGLDLSINRLLVMRSRNNETLCFIDENGDIVNVKARKVMKMMEQK